MEINANPYNNKLYQVSELTNSSKFLKNGRFHPNKTAENSEKKVMCKTEEGWHGVCC